jgi:hypothetical protein
LSAALPSQPPSSNSFPPSEKYFGQKQGKHWHSFFLLLTRVE